MAPTKQVVVIGAGVLGLSCAVRLKEAGFGVIIVAKDLPGDLDIDYASPWAGAHFRPVPVTTESELLERKLTAETYEYSRALSRSDPESGVGFCPGLEFFESPSKAYTDLDVAQQCCTWPGFRVLGPEELPLSAKWGVTYDAWVVDSPRYLLWLQRQLGDDIVVIRRSINHLSDVTGIVHEETGDRSMAIHAIINATGTGLADPSSFISRGQFLLISNAYSSTISYHYADGSSTVVVPRFGSSGTLIGGSKEPHDYNSNPDESSTERIVKRVSQLCPDLLGDSGIDIMRVNVGRRPMRKGGLRLEADPDGDGMSPPIVHCYGAGGSGFKISWGAATVVLDMVKKL